MLVIFLPQISLIDTIVFLSIAHEDITEVVDASGSSMVLNAASYVLSSQISEKVISILNMHSLSLEIRRKYEKSEIITYMIKTDLILQ